MTGMDEDLNEELFDFSTATNGDVVKGEILSVDKYRGDVRVTIRLPTGRTFSENMEYPKGDSESWKFVRLVRSCGYSLGAAEHIIGAEVNCRYDENWKILAPKRRRTRMMSKLEIAVATLATPCWLPWGLYKTMKSDYSVDNTGDYMLASASVLCVWVVSIGIAMLILAAVMSIIP